MKYSDHLKNLIKFFYLFVSSLPGLFILCFYSLMLRCYFVFGTFPKFNDPISKFFPIHNNLLTSLVLGSIFLALPWLLTTLIALVYKHIFSEKFIMFNALLYAGGIVLLILAMGLDPTTSWEWFFD